MKIDNISNFFVSKSTKSARGLNSIGGRSANNVNKSKNKSKNKDDDEEGGASNNFDDLKVALSPISTLVNPQR